MTGVVATFLGLNVEAQRGQQPPSIGFGGAQVSLGMTVEQVEKNLAASARHIEFMSDKHTAVVRVNNAPVPSGDEGQVTFFDGHVAYAAFQFPATHDAVRLAQEIAGAVENMDAKVCAASNYSSHGTGGGFSQTIFDCGSKSFNVMTVETLGANERYTHVEITIGGIPTPAK
jgi:prepilin-type processing-associated H-X9-DG protein